MPSALPAGRPSIRIGVVPVLLAILSPAAVVGQSRGVQSPQAAQRVESLVKDLQWRNIGPSNMSGRVVDIDAVDSNPSIVLVAAASGGAWKSVNSGTTWEPIFTHYGTANIGDVEFFQPDPDIIWVGTGEPCVRNSVGWGDGIYKSTDGGRTFTNMGLKDTHIIADVVTHPTNPEIVYVAAQGHVWGYNRERGVFKTTDGGRTWRKLTNGLPDDDRTGASALVMDPSNPNVLYAGMWERIRHPYNFESGGPNGGIFKSTDGGETWTKLTNGLPAGETGKIGIDIYRKDPRIVIAIVEHGYQPEPRINNAPNPDYTDMTKLGTGIYRSEDGGATWSFISRNNSRPFYFSHIWIDPGDANRVYVLAGSAQVSEDGGRTFTGNLRGIEGDFHALWIDPSNSDRFYVANDKGAYGTFDRGEHFVMYDNMDIGQFYAVTLDNRDPYYVYGGLQDSGNWGGPSNSRDVSGIFTDHWFKFHSGDGFHTTVDPNDWHTVYTESQGGGIRRYDAVFRQVGHSIVPNPSTILNWSDVLPDYSGDTSRLPEPAFRFNWSAPLILSPHDSKTLLFGGNYLFRSRDRGETWTIISPDLSTNDPVLTNPESGGLTRDVTGAETHATAMTISESPLIPGTIWVGTDDGNVQLTRDAGGTWTNVRTNIPTAAARGGRTSLRPVPARTWVSRVEASHFDPATAYVSFDGHRSDDFKPYIYRTTDYGQTWTDVTANLPQDEPVYVVKEDLKNPRLLFAGTERTVWTSIDGGTSWHRLANGLPTVPVHDLVIHPRDGDLVAATHGRSIWILDDVSPLEELNDAVLDADVYLFPNRTATKWHGVSRGATRGHFLFIGRNPLTMMQPEPQNSPGDIDNAATIDFYLKNSPSNGRAHIEISDPTGRNTFSADIDAAAGINRYMWRLRFTPAGGRGAGGGRGGRGGGGGGGGAVEGGFGGRGGRGGGPVADAGTYIVRLTIDGRTARGIVTVREDPATAGISD
jgi:photosystem II stability/assembly factor-like uncharacterized protein